MSIASVFACMIFWIVIYIISKWRELSAKSYAIKINKYDKLSVR